MVAQPPLELLLLASRWPGCSAGLGVKRTHSIRRMDEVKRESRKQKKVLVLALTLLSYHSETAGELNAD